MRRELVDDVVDRLARLDHDDDDPRRFEGGDEPGNAVRRNETPLAAVVADHRIGAFAMPVVERHAEPAAGGVARQIGAHHRQSEHAKIGFLRFCHWTSSRLTRVRLRRDAPTLASVVGGNVVVKP